MREKNSFHKWAVRQSPAKWRSLYSFANAVKSIPFTLHWLRVSFTTAVVANKRTTMLIAIIVSSAVSLCSAQLLNQTAEIRVQILDSRTHRPMTGRKVQIALSGMDGEWYRDCPIMTGRTGMDGVVVFEIKQPVPPRIDVGDLSGYPCWFPEYIATKEVLERGVVLDWHPSGIKKADKWCTADSQAHQPQQKPGEVVLFVRPLNAWQNYWYTLLK